jgi:hypothetical protein
LGGPGVHPHRRFLLGLVPFTKLNLMHMTWSEHDAEMQQEATVENFFVAFEEAVAAGNRAEAAAIITHTRDMGYTALANSMQDYLNKQV